MPVPALCASAQMDWRVPMARPEPGVWVELEVWTDFFPRAVRAEAPTGRAILSEATRKAYTPKQPAIE